MVAGGEEGGAGRTCGRPERRSCNTGSVEQWSPSPVRGRDRDRIGDLAGHVRPRGPPRQQSRDRLGRRRIPLRRTRGAGLLRAVLVSQAQRGASLLSSRGTPPRRRSTRTSPRPGCAERITGWPVSWKCAVAWRFGESSQHRITPHCVHMRRCTQVLPIAMHASHTRTSGSSVCSIVSRWVQESLTCVSSPRRRAADESPLHATVAG